MIRGIEGSHPCNYINKKDNRNNTWRRVLSVVAAIALSLPLRGVFNNDTGSETKNDVPQLRPNITTCVPDIDLVNVPETINDYVPKTVVDIDPTPAPAPAPGLPTPSPSEPVIITDSSKIPPSSQRVNF